MRKEKFTITNHYRAAKDTYVLNLMGDSSEVMVPGQFVELALPGTWLRRPFGVCDWNPSFLTLLYKVVGKGTRELSLLKEGAEVDVLLGLGKGFDLDACGKKPLLCAGGAGVAPLYFLCAELRAKEIRSRVLLGFNTAEEVVMEQEFRDMGADVTVCTLDGSKGHRGFVTDLMGELEYSHVCACGPWPMMQAVSKAAKTDAQFSLEARMGCGFGACMGCTILTNHGPKRVCADGPVFRKEEILW